MDFIFYAALIGLISGVVGTTGGGFFVLLVKKFSEQLLTLVLGISAGIMTVVVFLDLIPEALNVGTILSTISGMSLGVGLIGLLDLTFPHHHFMKSDDNEYFKAGVLLAVGIALHNIPEGLAIGAGYSATDSLGIGLAIIMAIQNFPEGMAMATTLVLARLKSLSIIIIVIISGIPMGIGAFFGAYLGSISDFVLSLSLGFAAGAMLYITFDELIPSAHEKARGKIAIVGILIGVFSGIVLTNIF